jgi:hypothetical protein
MTPRTPQGEVFWALLSSSKLSGVPEDSDSRLFQVLGFTPTLGQSRGATPEMESRNCPECVPVGLPGLWTAITPCRNLGSQQGLNQSCSPRKELSNAVSHSQSACREQVDARLLVVGSQTVNLTPDASFAHNLRCRCPNDQCESILDIYTLRPFQ